MPTRLANKPHTSSTKLNCIINLQSTTIKATGQKLHPVLMVIQAKNLILLSCMSHLIISPILDGLPKKKNIQTTLFLGRYLHNQIYMVDNLFCNLDFINDNVEKQCLSSTLPIITNSFAKANILTINVTKSCWMQV